jgi:hypothetical protein
MKINPNPWSTARVTALIGALTVSILVAAPAAASKTWVTGDVFAGVGDGSYKVYSNTGVFKETISDGMSGFTTGCAFNPTLTRLYTTNFTNTKVVVYDDAIPHAILQVIDTGIPSPGGNSEAIVFDAAGNFYVGHAGDNHLIQKYDSAGNLLATYSAAVTDRGTDWLELAADQKTIFYTSEEGEILRYDVLNNMQLPDFADIGNVSYALRLLPPGDGSGGLLVANTVDVKRLDGSGAVVQTYDAPGENAWFSLSLDPNGTSFWAGDFLTSNFYRFNIATGAVEVGPINTGTGPSTFFGLCVKGEPTAALPRKWRMTHGFELHCNIQQGPNNLEVNWGKGNKFHLETLTSAACMDDPNIVESPPVAGFDTYIGSGTGRYNGAPGATATWTFTDAGEPGKNDTVRLTIKDSLGNTVLTVSGKLSSGNHQAHPE